ncbi:MAG TPA: hypothetical protein VIG33_17785 [Pseudobdellovibrionaceae bacterium]|jgi:hypothetical protein
MIKLALLLSLSLLSISSVSCWAGGGDFVNNGGGLAEKNILYAYEKMDTYIQLCLKAESCKLNATQRALLEKIYQALPQEKQEQQIFFGSERKTPGFFIIEGNVRVAKTGDKVGSPIQVNADLLYSKNETGSYDPVTIPEAVAILIHELGHHHGEHSHEELDLIGVRVSLLLQQKIISTPLVPWAPSEISASVLNSDLLNSFPEVLLNVGEDVMDVSRIYAKEVHCEVLSLPIPIFPVPDLELMTRIPAGSLFHNVHWEKIKDKGTYIEVRITGNVSNNCKYKNNIGIRNNNYQLSISFKVNKVSDRWVLDPASIALLQFTDPWWKVLRIPSSP